MLQGHIQSIKQWQIQYFSFEMFQIFLAQFNPLLLCTECDPLINNIFGTQMVRLTQASHWKITISYAMLQLSNNSLILSFAISLLSGKPFGQNTKFHDLCICNAAYAHAPICSMSQTKITNHRQTHSVISENRHGGWC